MGRQLRVQRLQIRNISDLRDRCLNIWYNLSPVIYQGFVASMPRRVEAVLRAKEKYFYPFPIEISIVRQNPKDKFGFSNRSDRVFRTWT
ncbi:transposase domain containing protein [Nephila pilipes]|uniref:Transposase domain containing protein n=1 Tax=Nephila pilipes TaxID=299642 RepID=A0A8X6QIU5_NEPPI|nr:transposase domain containing protein [Nephila pilipes]